MPDHCIHNIITTKQLFCSKKHITPFPTQISYNQLYWTNALHRLKEYNELLCIDHGLSMIMGSMEAQKSVVYITSNSSSLLKFLMAITTTFLKIILNNCDRRLWMRSSFKLHFPCNPLKKVRQKLLEDKPVFICLKKKLASYVSKLLTLSL